MEPRPPDRLPPVTLVLGGARAGKSRYAEAAIERANPPGAVYVATAEAGDVEMATRIAAHRAQRGSLWRTVEAPIELVEAIEACDRPEHPILVDCLTLWLSNLMLGGHDCDEACDRLADRLAAPPAPLVLVSNEVGLGIVPDNRLARDFRDQAGRLNQRIAEVAQRVVFVAAGLPLLLKDRPFA
ncbi:MAG: bifunctional adenosylcobinamide kinase/adenosylcobinamide-phosphate guanylyltransferase [Reyranellaceae bacterium]